jgi:hypothetical protein
VANAIPPLAIFSKTESDLSRPRYEGVWTSAGTIARIANLALLSARTCPNGASRQVSGQELAEAV